ncbi:DUF4870 domain-containing protein [bacterium]|nr:DUF4870 domain-containing protein [bacterium]
MEKNKITPQTSSAEVNEDKVMGLLCYLGILVLVPILLKKDSEFVKFHIQQGLALLVVGIVWTFVWWVLAFIPVIGLTLDVLGGIVLFVIWIIGIVNVLSGQKKELPLVGGLAKYFRL